MGKETISYVGQVYFPLTEPYLAAYPIDFLFPSNRPRFDF